MWRFFIALISLGLLAGACNDAAQNESAHHENGYAPVLKTREDSLFHEVMQGHDAGMAKVNKLRKNRDECKRLLDSLDKLPAPKIDAAYKQHLLQLHAALDKADKDMFQWMETFKHDSAEGNKELRIQYLELEKQKVTVVKDQIFAALQQADSLLKK